MSASPPFSLNVHADTTRTHLLWCHYNCDLGRIGATFHRCRSFRALAVAATVNVALATPLPPFIIFIANGTVIIDEFTGAGIFDRLVGGTTVFPHVPVGSQRVRSVLRIGR